MNNIKNKQSIVKRLNLVPRLLCLFFAAVIWVYVMMVDSPDYEETFEDVPITLVGTSALENEKNLSVFNVGDMTVDVTVKGQKSVISRYSSDDLKVNANIGNATEAGIFSFNLFFDLPGGLSLVSSSANTVDLFIDQKTVTNVDVKPKLSAYKIASDYEIGQLSCDTDIISVSGPATVLNDISYALVDVNMGDSYIAESLTTECNVTLMNSNDETIESRYLKMSKNSVKVTVPVFAYKEVSLCAEYKYGFFNDENTSVTFSPSTVRVKGDPAKLDGVGSLSVTTLDEKSIADDTTLLVDIACPDGISLADGEPCHATIEIKRNNMKKRAISVKNIVVDHEKDMNCDVITNSVSVVIVADSDIIMDISAADITLYADLSDFAGSEGTVLVPVEVQINFNKGTVYELGSYNIQVNVG